MILNCPVILNNSAVTVVRFGSTDIQLPSIGRDVDTVKIQCKDGRYSVVCDEQVESVSSVESPPVKAKKKKTTRNIKNDVIDTDESMNCDI